MIKYHTFDGRIYDNKKEYDKIMKNLLEEKLSFFKTASLNNYINEECKSLLTNNVLVNFLVDSAYDKYSYLILEIKYKFSDENTTVENCVRYKFDKITKIKYLKKILEELLEKSVKLIKEQADKL